MNERQIRGYSILAKGDKPQALDTENFAIPSQSGNGKYRVSKHGSEWSCECPDFQKRKSPCKHIYSIQFYLKVRTKRSNSFTIPEIADKFCPYCKSGQLIKRGIRKNHGEPKQRYACKKCGRRFVADLCKRFKGTDKTITAVMDMYYKGMSVRDIQAHLKQFYNFKVHYMTIFRWIKRFTKQIADHTDKVKVKSCGIITADETMLKAGGDWAYMWNVMDKDSRFLIANYTSDGRDGVYARAVFEETKAKLESLPRLIITDGYGGYKYAKRKVFGEYSRVEHMHNIHFMNKKRNNNQIERYMGSIKQRTKVMRGMQNHKTGNDLMRGWVAYYNFLRPHSALNGLTPAEAVGINIGLNGRNRWLELLKTTASGTN